MGSYPYSYVRLLCNVSPSFTFPPVYLIYHILTELFMWFNCIELGRNRFGDLEQHGWTPVLGQDQYSNINFSVWVWLTLSHSPLCNIRVLTFIPENPKSNSVWQPIMKLKTRTNTDQWPLIATSYLLDT